MNGFMVMLSVALRTHLEKRATPVGLPAYLQLRMATTFSHLTPPDSIISRWDTRWKLAALLVVMFALATLRSILPLAFAFLFALVLTFLAKLPPRWLLFRIGMAGIGLLPFVILIPFTWAGSDGIAVGPLTFHTDALPFALAILLKGLGLLLLGLLILATAPLPATLAAAHHLWAPGILVQLAGLSYRYSFLLLEELNRIRIALRVRGFRNLMNRHSYRTAGNVVGTLLVRGFDRAERVSEAMRCRGFDGRFRTLQTFSTSLGDVLGFTIAILLGGILVVWDRGVL